MYECVKPVHLPVITFRLNKIKVEVPEIECDDGSKLSPLSVSFADGAGKSANLETHICENTQIDLHLSSVRNIITI